MDHQLLLHHANTYLRIKTRRAIWVQGFNNKWHSDYSQPTEKFLLRFDEAIQMQIMAIVRVLAPTPRRRPTIEEMVEDASS